MSYVITEPDERGYSEVYCTHTNRCVGKLAPPVDKNKMLYAEPYYTRNIRNNRTGGNRDE